MNLLLILMRFFNLFAILIILHFDTILCVSFLFHSSEIDLQLPDLTPSEHTSYPDRGRKWSMYKPLDRTYDFDFADQEEEAQQ